MQSLKHARWQTTLQRAIAGGVASRNPVPFVQTMAAASRIRGQTTIRAPIADRMVAETRGDEAVAGEMRAEDVAMTAAVEEGGASRVVENGDKRKRNDDEQAEKRRKIEDGQALDSKIGIQFSAEDIAGEERKPKRKVAVLLGYAGSGYKGMQISPREKTIEGDLFTAFIKAGAIAKANADDPKKSSLVRCARTDKGVHAAGNVISLKLIVEDPDIVKKINEHLPPQIRIWGLERTNGSFSCYQACDSRWYEYLIPTYAFLPPHPRSFLGKKLVESAEQEGVYESYQSRQEEVSSFWEAAEKEYIEPILAEMEPELRAAVMDAIHSSEEDVKAAEQDKQAPTGTSSEPLQSNDAESNVTKDDLLDAETTVHPNEAANELLTAAGNLGTSDASKSETPKPALSRFEIAVKEIKAAYLTAKKAHRISSNRRERVQEALKIYLGTQNFHNYTIQKSFFDPSAKRVIRSFDVNPNPIIINNTEWLSLKVHGQSFMMHQIRKMVAMVALVVRCGCTLDRIRESYGPDKISIPKAPGLGLLLERPVFDSYNERAVKELEKEKIDFGRFTKEIEEFKQREIYERIFREEEKDNQFHTFFNHIDHYRTDYFLWVTAAGIAATKQSLNKGDAVKKAKELVVDSEDEADANGEDG
ncbi:MAG: tRNA pseudouridine synthase 1 [Claussenomyces sp. TS43310]|nr:MAG: tRNA pseudouridine synthase 1 [Claussenomyces sp. TS43310]